MQGSGAGWGYKGMDLSESLTVNVVAGLGG